MTSGPEPDRDRSAGEWICFWRRQAEAEWPSNPLMVLAYAFYALIDLVPLSSIIWRTTVRYAQRSMALTEASALADTVLQWYILLTTVPLVAGLFIRSDAAHTASAILGVTRLVDLVPTFVGVLLFQGTGERVGLSISATAVYLVHIVFAYACITQAWLSSDLVSTCIQPRIGTCSPAGSAENLYVAVTNIFTLGNAYRPISGGSQAVSALEPVTGVIVAGAVLAEILRHERDKSTPPPATAPLPPLATPADPAKEFPSSVGGPQ